MTDAAARLRNAFSHTARALRLVSSRPDAIAILTGTILAYLAAYSYATGALVTTTRTGFDLQVAADPLGRVFQQTGFLAYEPIARVQGLRFSYLFSPVEFTIAVVLAGLVGVNLAVSYLAVVQPRTCGLAPSTGVFAAVPALLSGAACCGPLLFVVLGIQATGILFTGVQALLPLSVVLLMGSLLYVGGRIDPAALES